MPKNIYILVLSGAYNLGDELILRSEIDFFRSQNPNVHITVATYDSDSFFGERKNIKFVSFFPNNFKKHFFKNIVYFFRHIWMIFRSDMVVVGWGGIIFDNEKNISFSKNLLEWKLRLLPARIFFKKIVFLGISLEVKNPENQQKLAQIFRENDHILPRDARSTQILEKFGFHPTTLYDSVFLMPPKDRSHRTSPHTVGIAIRDGFFSQKDVETLSKFVNFVSKKGYQVVFLSHSLSLLESHNDEIFVKKIFGEQYKITKTLNETYRAYSDIDIVISMRLHSAILAAQFGVPMMMISYWPKTENLAKILKISNFCLDAKCIDEQILKSTFLLLENNFSKNQAKICAQYRKIHTNFLQKIAKIGIMEI